MPGFDVLIREAKVVDGTGNPWFYGDVALSGDRVVDVMPPGLIPPSSAREVIEAAGLVVCPGFIDIQSDSVLHLMIDGRSLSKITQGIATEIMGESWTPAPFGGRIDEPFKARPLRNYVTEWARRAKTWVCFGEWLEAIKENGVSPNVGAFLGGGTVRRYAKGEDVGPPTTDELATMRRVVRDAMEGGALGISYALIYPVDAYATTEEIVEVCREVREYGGVYVTHLRSEGDRLLEGIEEALNIGRQAGLPVEIYHFKAAGKHNWHKMPDAISAIDKGRANGLDVTANMYPYAAASASLAAVLPPWAVADGWCSPHDPDTRARIREESLSPSGNWEAMADLCTPAGVVPIGLKKPENQQFIGKPLSEIAVMRGQEWVDAALDLLWSEDGPIKTIYYMAQTENLALQLQQPWIKVATDEGGFDPVWGQEVGLCHPRAYGTCTRVLGKCVREDHVITLEEAIRKMSSAVAERLGLQGRGLLRKGYYADVVLFDPQMVCDQATYEEPHQLSVGIRDVWVNGIRVLKDSVHTGAKPGRIVKGPGRI